MSARRPTRKTIVLVAVAVLLLAGLAALTGCGTKDKRDITDSSSFFHFKIPAHWQSRVDPTILTVYADKKLPSEGQTYDALSVIVLLTDQATETPVPTALADFLALAETGRGWTEVETTDPVDTMVGGRPASRIDITGTDANGRGFKGAYIWVRTNGRDCLIMAVTPPDKWEKSQDDIEAILTDWYWHKPDPSLESTATPEGEAVEGEESSP